MALWMGSVLLLLTHIIVAAAITPISIKGTKFFDDEGQQFFVKGVAYQPGGASEAKDPLADTNQCQLDAGFMKDLGVNVVRVYLVDPTADHDGCMQALASNGIYAWIDLPTPTQAINRADPEWTLGMFDHYTSVIDAFAKYNNTLVFTIANEVINDDNESVGAGPYIKAAVRDIKAFRSARGYRKIPVSYGATDIPSIQSLIADYLACGDEADTVEIFGLNAFGWCGNSSYAVSGYDTLYTQLQHLNIPAVFTEVGCNTITPRTFEEVAVILGSVFPIAFSGTIVYEWTQETNQYGLVEYSSNGSSQDFPSPLVDYSNLQKVFSTANPISTSKTDYTPSNTQPACPSTDTSWTIDGFAPLPTIAALNIDTVTARTTYVDAAAAETSGTSITGSRTGTAAGQTSSASASSATEASQGLGTGAIAGIAVGGAIIGIAAIVGAVFFARRRKVRLAAARHQEKGPGSQSAYNETNGKPELQGTSVGRFAGPKQELDGRATGGFHGQEYASRNAVPVEIDTRPRNAATYEVEGSVPTSYYDKMGSSGYSTTTGEGSRR